MHGGEDSAEASLEGASHRNPVEQKAAEIKFHQQQKEPFHQPAQLGRAGWATEAAVTADKHGWHVDPTADSCNLKALDFFTLNATKLCDAWW